MVQPINYMAQIPQVNLAQSLGEGLRLGAGIREMQEKREAAQQAAQQAAQMKQQLAADLAAAQANPTQSTWANMITKYPQFREAFGDASKMYGQERVDNEFFAGAEVSNALEKGDVNAASMALDTIIEARKNSKQPVGVYEQVRESLKSNDIKGAQSRTNSALAFLDPDKFKKIADATGNKVAEGYEVITPEKVKTLGLPAGNTYQRNTKTGKIESLGTTGERFEIIDPAGVKALGLPAGTYQKDVNTGKITAVGGGGVTVNLPPQIGSIPPDYRMTYDGNKPVAMEVIPGSKTARELEAAAGKGQMAAESTLTTAGVVIQDISRLTNAIKKQKLTDPVTGTLGAVVGEQGGVLAAGSARRSAEGLVRTIQANIGFDRLNQMRLESPTGGALGNITEQELKFLQSVLGSIDLNQKDADIIRNLERLYKKDPKTGVESGLYVNIMKKAAAYPNASKFGFGGGAPAGGTPTPVAPPAGGGATPGMPSGFRLLPG